MPIPGPGTAISMTTIATEFGGTVPHSLNEYYRGGGLVPNTPTNAAIPTSGTIAIGNFYGSSSRLTVNLTISANTFNYDVFTNRSPAYVAGVTDVIVTVNPGVTVGSTSTPTYAMLVPSGFSPTDTVTIVNNGLIQGMGGGGGAAGTLVPGPAANSPASAGGGAGGNAIFANRPTVITNNSVIAAGGGGGGGGSATSGGPIKANSRGAGSGGGGGAGSNGGAGGAGGINPLAPTGRQASGIAGSPGTSPAGGAGGPSITGVAQTSGAGGSGGGRGAAGTAGGLGTFSPGTTAARSVNGGGGAAGNYIVGNPFVTWPATGTREGGVA